MKQRHPYEWLSQSVQKRAFILFVVLTLVIFVALQVLDAPLKNEVAPSGIVSFELAGSLTKAERIADSWGQEGRVYAGLSLGLDFLFMVLYAVAIGLGCILTGCGLTKGEGLLWSMGVILCWGLIVVAMMDSMENYALIQVLLGAEKKIWPIIARWCAIPKFLIVAVGILYCIAGAVAIGVTPHKNKKN